MSIRLTGMSSGLDTDSMVKELVNAYEKQGQKYTKAKTKTEWKQEAWETLNGKIKSFYTKYASNMRFSDAYRKKSTTVSDSTKATVIAGDNAVTGTQTLKVNALAKAGYLTGATSDALKNATSSTKLSDICGTIAEDTIIKLNTGSKDGANFDASKASVNEITINSDTTIGNLVSSINSIDGITASFDETNGRFFISSDESGVANNFNLEGNSSVNSILTSLGLAGTGAVKIEGTDASITLNGADFSSSNNTFSVNGLTITAKETTGTSTLSLVTDTDVDTIYNSVKDFFKEYNSLVNELDKLYNAKSSKGYEPLTDEEKEAMSDDEIEKWEGLIKDSLLRRDSEVSNLASIMKTAMLSTYTDDDGKTYSLSSFGIETLSYFEAADNEKGAYHIAGNSDDAYSSSSEDKLKKAISTNPSLVENFFTTVVGNLYNEMKTIQSESNSYKSYGSFYSDKKLTSDLTTQQNQITKWEEYVADMEEKYYKQFTAMESSMSELNSQQSYLSQLFSS